MVQPRRPLASTLLALLLLSGCAEQPPTPSEGSTAQALVTTDAAGAEVLLRHSSARAIVAEPGGLFRLELPRRELAEASHALHEELGRCGGFMLDRPSGGATPLGQVSTRALQVAYTIDNAATVSALLAPLQESKLRETIQGLADFPTRFHDTEEGYAAALWIRDRWQAHAAGRADVTVQLVEHDYTPQPSISLTIAGSKAPEELVILGGHMDSINPRGGAAPGADDNASGIAVLDEVIRTAMLLDYRPERTVVFYAYAAEEIGLVGSAQIAEAAAERELAVAGVLQLDMTNFSSAPTPYLALVTDYTDAALTAYARTLIETYVKLPWQDTECGYACSDHASWQESGFPVHYVHEARISEGNDQIHTDQDTLELSDGTARHSLYFAQYSAAFMAELAKGAVSECDAARPCPAGQQCEAGSCLPLPGSAGAGSGGAGGTSGGTGSALGGSGGSNTVSGGGAAGAGISAVSGAAGTSALAGTGGAGGALVAATAPPGPAAGDAEGCACRAPVGSSRSGSSAAWLVLLMFVASRRLARRDSVRISCADPA